MFSLALTKTTLTTILISPNQNHSHNIVLTSPNQKNSHNNPNLQINSNQSTSTLEKTDKCPLSENRYNLDYPLNMHMKLKHKL